MLLPEERHALIARLAELPVLVAEAVHGLTDAQLDTPYREGGWTVRQVVHHLVDSHVNGYVRMRLILTEERPALKPYDQDAWAALHDAAHGPVAPSLQVLEGLHARWAALLSSLPDAAWARTGLHPARGAMSLDDFLELYARHGPHHAGQIQELRTRNGW
jgi:uncharacterized damage-inducible protein DinB